MLAGFASFPRHTGVGKGPADSAMRGLEAELERHAGLGRKSGRTYRSMGGVG